VTVTFTEDGLHYCHMEDQASSDLEITSHSKELSDRPSCPTIVGTALRKGECLHYSHLSRGVFPLGRELERRLSLGWEVGPLPTHVIRVCLFS
jgi:hypothetical protein